MAKRIIMPKLDMTMESGEISNWFVNEGDEVKIGDVLFEVISEKAAIEVESTAKGVVLKIFYSIGDVVKVADTVAIIGKIGEDYSSLLTNESIVQKESSLAEENDNTNTLAINIENNTESIPSTPAAKTLAKKEAVELRDVTPNQQGIIRKKNVEEYLEKRVNNYVKSTPLAKKIALEHGVELSDIATDKSRIYSEDVLEKVKKPMTKAANLTGIRKISANRLTNIWQSVPMVTLTVEVDVSKIMDLCDRLNSKSDSKFNKINMTDVLIKIMGMALVEHPRANVSLIDNMLIEHQEINISLAVALDEGLIVPVIKNVDQKGLQEINGEKRRLIEKAKNGSINKDELTGGCMTISNIGMLGADIFTPILNAPESHILGLGRVNKKPVVVEDEIVIRPMMWLSHTFDHRALDGVPAMKLLATIRDMIEEPYKIIL